VYFHLEHEFACSANALLEAMIEPAFHLSLELPDLGAPEVLEHEDDGVVGRLRLRYAYLGHLDPIARRLLGGGDLMWIQEIRIDRSAAGGVLHFEAERQPRLLHGDATVEVRPVTGAVRRTLDGEVVVGVPIVGAAAERRIVNGLRARLDIEAQALAASLPS
jgi:hypothetical protein